MAKRKMHLSLIPIYIMIWGLLLAAGFIGNKTVTSLSEYVPLTGRTCVIIDAGHGGIDGGAISCTGISESEINLQIALRLDDLCHILGLKTLMIRSSDCSVHTSGETIAAKKISDLKERVRIVNQTEKAVLISIHQNYFTESRYYGAQVFFANTEGSEELAETLQSNLNNLDNIGNGRKIKKANGIYVMENVNTTAVLLECGFLSNPEEEAKLRNKQHQIKICSVLSSVLVSYLNT